MYYLRVLLSNECTVANSIRTKGVKGIEVNGILPCLSAADNGIVAATYWCVQGSV